MEKRKYTIHLPLEKGTDSDYQVTLDIINKAKEAAKNNGNTLIAWVCKAINEKLERDK